MLPLKAMQCAMYFRYVGDVIFSHHGANGPESNTTRMFRPVRHMQHWGKGCRLRQHLVWNMQRRKTFYVEELCACWRVQSEVLFEHILTIKEY